MLLIACDLARAPLSRADILELRGLARTLKPSIANIVTHASLIGLLSSCTGLVFYLRGFNCDPRQLGGLCDPRRLDLLLNTLPLFYLRKLDS